jgi:cbb3-type cytochrome oxidase maturation protein
MDILYLLVPLSVVLVFLIGALFWWSLRSGQFDDLEGPAHRILQDEEGPPVPFDLNQRKGGGSG